VTAQVLHGFNEFFGGFARVVHVSQIGNGKNMHAYRRGEHGATVNGTILQVGCPDANVPRHFTL
jgi:hypothetical protein